MFIHNFTLENATETDWSFGPLLVPAESLKVVFDEDEISTYDVALWSMLNALDAVYAAAMDGTLVGMLNGELMDEMSWACLRDTLAALLAAQKVGYHACAFCFDMKTNKFKVIHPLSGKVFSVQCVEELA